MRSPIEVEDRVPVGDEPQAPGPRLARATGTDLTDACRLLAGCLAWLAVTMGALALFGWAAGLTFFTRVLPGAATMKPNTAATFLLTGCSIVLLVGRRGATVTDRRRRLATVLAGVVVFVGGITLLEYALRIDLGADTWWFADAVRAAGDRYPGRMAGGTAIGFVAIGLALMTMDRVFWQQWRPSQYLATACALAGLLAFVGYTYDIGALYEVPMYETMAVHTALLFFALGLAVLLLRPDRGWFSVLTSRYDGGVIARRLVPAILLAPPVLGWLCLAGWTSGWFRPEFGAAMFAVGSVAIVSVVAWRAARSLNRTDEARRRDAGDVERAITDSLHAKELMLQEVHHRVRNNLQIISSLLNMHAQKDPDGRVGAVFADCIARIRGMAMVHERLYRSGEFGRVALHAHLRDISDIVRESSGGTGGRVPVKFVGDEVWVDVERAVAVGMICNEWVTNATKYAFPDGAQGSITVELRRAAGTELVVSVTDDGVGRDVAAALDDEGMGQRIVSSLARQIGGRVEPSAAGGARGLRCNLHFDGAMPDEAGSTRAQVG